MSLSDKIISVAHGYMSFKSGDVKKSIKELKKKAFEMNGELSEEDVNEIFGEKLI